MMYLCMIVVQTCYCKLPSLCFICVDTVVFVFVSVILLMTLLLDEFSMWWLQVIPIMPLTQSVIAAMCCSNDCLT